MVVKARPPAQIKLCTGLQKRRAFARCTAGQNAGMAPMGGCKHLKDRRGFSVTAAGQQDAGITPLHTAKGVPCAAGTQEG